MLNIFLFNSFKSVSLDYRKKTDLQKHFETETDLNDHEEEAINRGEKDEWVSSCKPQ